MSDDPLLAAEAVSARPGCVLIDCRPDPAAYAAGHLAGAVHAQLERDLSAPVADAKDGGRHPLPAVATLCARLGQWGVTPSAEVVAYDDQGGWNAAARLWWLLRALGHARVRVVDGGLAALRAAGHELTTELPVAAGAPAYPAARYLAPIALLAEVDRARSDAARCVLDVRAAPRFRGETEPFDPVAGHIPGALNVPLTENLGPDGRFKSPDVLRALYLEALAGRAPARTIVHCGSGVTACHTLLAMERAGLAGAALYVGSWSEWCRHPELPRSP